MLNMLGRKDCISARDAGSNKKESKDIHHIALGSFPESTNIHLLIFFYTRHLVTSFLMWTSYCYLNIHFIVHNGLGKYQWVCSSWYIFIFISRRYLSFGSILQVKGKVSLPEIVKLILIFKAMVGDIKKWLFMETEDTGETSWHCHVVFEPRNIHVDGRVPETGGPGAQVPGSWWRRSYGQTLLWSFSSDILQWWTTDGQLRGRCQV